METSFRCIVLKALDTRKLRNFPNKTCKTNQLGQFEHLNLRETI